MLLQHSALHNPELTGTAVSSVSCKIKAGTVESLSCTASFHVSINYLLSHLRSSQPVIAFIISVVLSCTQTLFFSAFIYETEGIAIIKEFSGRKFYKVYVFT